MHIKDDFSSGAPISQVPASWFNRVAKFVNSIIGGEHVEFEKHDDGSDSRIVLHDIATVGDTEPENTALEADAGESEEAARADHVHSMRGNCETNIAATFAISITPDYKDSTDTSSGRQTYLNMVAWAPPAKLTGDDTAHTPVGWERGKTAWKNGHVVDATHPAVGCSIKVCSHTILRTVGGTQRVENFFTRLEFDENGLLIRAVPCTDWYVIPVAT